MDLRRLYAEFPRKAVHWRAQTLTRDKTAALALAYIDARDVMERLDDVCGPDRWSDSYVETASGRVICTIRIKVGDEWVSKSDGAGNTQVEAEKGGISDAFKRAAVKWGIGRYLYNLPSVWVPCSVNEKGQWKAWTADPWSCVRGAKPPHVPDAPDTEPAEDRIALEKQQLETAETLEALRTRWEAIFRGWGGDHIPQTLVATKEAVKARLEKAAA